MRCQDILQHCRGSREDNQTVPGAQDVGMLFREVSPQAFNLPSTILDDLLKEFPQSVTLGVLSQKREIFGTGRVV
jgi:hypothetical protein